MDGESVQAALEREHREIDSGIETFLSEPGNGQRRTASMMRAIAALRRHIYLEETFLFPPLRDAGLIAPVFVMVREHGLMWQTLDRLEPVLKAGTADAAVLGLGRELLAQLQAHNPKEEQILYPQADTSLTTQATEELRTFLSAGELPDGWRCEAAQS